MPEQSNRLTIVAFGDSVTEGVGRSGVTEETTYPAMLRRTLTQALGRDVRVINAGVGGDITPLGLKRMERDVLRHRPDVVLILYGVNDAGYFRPPEGYADTPRTDLDTYRSCLRQMVDNARAVGSTPVLLTPAPMGSKYGYAWLEPYRRHGLNFLVRQYMQALREVAKEKEVPLIDIYRAFEAHPDREAFLPDGLHPNVEGCAFIARVVADHLLQDLL